MSERVNIDGQHDNTVLNRLYNSQSGIQGSSIQLIQCRGGTSIDAWHPQAWDMFQFDTDLYRKLGPHTH